MTSISFELVPLTDHLAAIPMEPGVLAWAMAGRRCMAAHWPDAVLLKYPGGPWPGHLRTGRVASRNHGARLAREGGAGAHDHAECQEEANLTEWRAISRFARNLALVHGGVRPRLYDVTMAAKGCVDVPMGG